jgi:hypothetical protein
MAVVNDIKSPFILMTGQKDPSIEREALRIGARLCIDKNEITTSILLKAIRGTLGI